MSEIPGWWWIAFTLVAAASQTARNALQKSLTTALGTIGATHVRFLFGMPFGILFLVLVLLATGRSLPTVRSEFVGWILLGGLSQIVATALMLAAMRLKSFVVATAYSKTEPVQIALFGLIFLGDKLSIGLVAAILMATVGVILMSWPRQAAIDVATWGADNRRAALFGVLSGGLFAMAAVGFRGAVLSVESDSFVLAATTTLACGQLLQAGVLTAWLLGTSPKTLIEIFKAWKPSLIAGFSGAFASQCWFLAFAIESVARVRTLGLVEILFAQIVTRQLFAQGSTAREVAGVLLVVIGVAVLLNV